MDTVSETEEARREKYIRKASTVIDFTMVVVFVFITYVSVLNKNILQPLASHNATSIDTIPDYDISSATVLSILFVGLALGQLCEWMTLPPLLGMLICGIVLRNLPLNLFVPRPWSSFLRRAAFVVILLRGGLSLNAEHLKTMKGACIRLALFPCTIEALSILIFSRLLFSLQWIFGFMLGFVLAAVSPAVVVPSMIRISQEGYGSRVSSLVVAAASLDDVYAITLFSVCFSIAFSTGDSLLWTVLRAPIEVAAGIGLALFLGYGLRYVRKEWRLVVLVSCGMASFFGCASLTFDSAGALCVLVTAFIVSPAWRDDEGRLSEEGSLRRVWDLFLQPLLFGLIGFELTFALLSLNLVLLGLLLLFIGLSFRTAAAFLATYGSGLSLRERLFVSLAWSPKATVQAALASLALDAVEKGGRWDEDCRQGAIVILAVAVLSILTTAPIGAGLIRVTAPILLEKEEETTEEAVELKALHDIHQ